MTFLKEFRLTWTPLLRIILSSTADVVADYFFYDSIVNYEGDAELDKFELYLFIFLVVAITMGVLTVLSVFIKGCSNGKSCGKIQGPLNKILGLEILLEDIPQFVLTAMITAEKGLLTPTAAFNIATSGFNFAFNLLEMCTPEIDQETSDKVPETVPAAAREDTTEPATIAVTGVAAEEEA